MMLLKFQVFVLALILSLFIFIIVKLIGKVIDQEIKFLFLV